MQEKVIEIIVYILSRLGPANGLEDIDVKMLSNEGYTDAEINTAFAWIFSKLESGESVLNEKFRTKGSHRVYHPAEKKILTRDAIGYLMQLKELGILSDPDIENVIDRLISAGYSKAGTDEVKLFVSTIIFSSDESSDLRTKLVLQNNETIH